MISHYNSFGGFWQLALNRLVILMMIGNIIRNMIRLMIAVDNKSIMIGIGNIGIIIFSNLIIIIKFTMTINNFNILHILID